MTLRIYITLFLFSFINVLQAQVGIGTTSPNATLDIRSSNQATPSNTDGILIPKVDAFPATNPTATQQGMLVYLTIAVGSKLPGFYYWDNTSTSWIGINSTVNSDADWFKVGTSTAPTLITDDMFHTGNMAIGKNTTSYPLEIQNTLFDRTINTNFANNTTNAVTKTGIFTTVSGTSNDTSYGLNTVVTATGSGTHIGNVTDLSGAGIGAQHGTSNNISNSGDNTHFGTSNFISGGGTGTHYATYNNISGTGTGQQIGTRNTISNSGNNSIFGISSSISGTGTGTHYGNYTDLSNTGSGDQYGTSNNLSNTGNGLHYGTSNILNGTGTAAHFGNYSSLTGAGTGRQYGVYNSLTNSGNNTHYGQYNDISGTGTGIHYGSYTDLTGTGSGQQIGENVTISNSGNALHYGFYSDINGTGAGDHYGNSNAISSSGSGIHYGSYNTLSGTGTGQQYGNYSSISNSGNATHYGSYNLLNGTGTGIKYGSYNLINAAAGGTHYGVYSEVLKAGTNYAGYFLGNVAIGTTNANNYIFPASRGTNGQIMQTDGSGNLSWQSLNSFAWQTTGNSGTTPATNFFGTTDNQDIVFKRFGVRAGYIGDPAYDASFNYNNGNTSFGANSLVNPTINIGSQFGVRNTAVGANVLSAISTGQRNTGMGDFAMFSNTTGSENTAIGSGALFSNTTSNSNVAIGRQAMTSYNAPLLLNTGNTAVGFAALRNSITGTNNVALGYEALRAVTGNGNVGIGFQAGRAETGSNRLYIENSSADQNSALIYGEFDNDVVRVNTHLQVGNPALAGYEFPTTRGSNGQVLQTNGAGSTSWVAPSSLAITETDPQVSSTTTNAVPKWNGTTLVDGVAVDDGTNLGVGIAPSAGNKLEVAGKTKTTTFQMTTGATANYVLQSDATGNATWAAPNNTLSVMRTNLSSNQALTNGGWQIINFNTVVFDVNSEFSTNRFTALKTGYYEVNSGYHTDDQSNTQFYSIAVYKNGALYQQTSGNHSNIGPVARNINCIVYLTAGDYIEIFAENYQSSVNIDAYSGKTFFEVRQIR